MMTKEEVDALLEAADAKLALDQLRGGTPDFEALKRARAKLLTMRRLSLRAANALVAGAQAIERELAAAGPDEERQHPVLQRRRVTAERLRRVAAEVYGQTRALPRELSRELIEAAAEVASQIAGEEMDEFEREVERDRRAGKL